MVTEAKRGGDGKVRTKGSKKKPAAKKKDKKAPLKKAAGKGKRRKPVSVFKPVTLKAIVRTFTAKEAKPGEVKKLSGRFEVADPKLADVCNLCFDKNATLQAIRSAKRAGAEVRIKCDPTERLLTMRTPSGNAEVSVQGMVLKKITYRLTKGDNGEQDEVLLIHYQHPSMKPLIAFLYDHLGGELVMKIEKMQGDLDFEG